LVRAADETTNEDLRRLIERKVRRRFLGLGYLFRQYIAREDLKTMLADARGSFAAQRPG
jgi:hypothetical protein